MFTTEFAKAAIERAVKTFCQVLAALLVADGTDLLSTDWGNQLSVAGMAAVISILTTVASGAITGQASIVRAETVAPAGDATP
jgi:hypothetical protein